MHQRAPVRAGEVDQQILLFLLGLGLGRLEVGLPKTFGGKALAGEGAKRHGRAEHGHGQEHGQSDGIHFFSFG